jgi:hypothetical protein
LLVGRRELPAWPLESPLANAVVERDPIVEMVAASVEEESNPQWIAMQLLQGRDMKAASELLPRGERVLSTARNKGAAHISRSS